MAQSYKVCPICKTLNHPNAMVCTTCGTSLGEVAPILRTSDKANPRLPFDFQFGETDLLESSVSRSARTGLLVVGVALIFAIGLIVGIVLTSLRGTSQEISPLLTSDTPMPTLNLPTVTLGPPTSTRTSTPPPTFTPTETGTPAPCIQRIVAGGSLIAAIVNCGYNTLDIMPTVMALNNIADAAALQEGQEIIIPWPSATIDPNAVTLAPTQEANSEANVAMASKDLALNTSIDAFAPTATSTLPAGVMWHTVQTGDNIITISVDFNANAKTLSELNPEIDFAQCEFGERFGGPECSVQLIAGQLLRVPAPSPTPTLSPTPDPNATATPTATPTYNEPSVVSPSDRQFFAANELITLRWIPSATLRTDELYIVNAIDITTGTAYQATTSELSLIVPQAWQATDAKRHDYQWTVGVLNTQTNQITFQTEPLIFVWQGLAEKSP